MHVVCLRRWIAGEKDGLPHITPSGLEGLSAYGADDKPLETLGRRVTLKSARYTGKYLALPGTCILILVGVHVEGSVF